MGMVANLLRVRRGEDYERGSAVASLHGDGRILSERSAAHMDRLVHAAFTALVPCFVSVRHACARGGFGVDAIFARPLSDRVFLYCHSLGTRRYFHRELHFFELPGAGVGGPASG